MASKLRNILELVFGLLVVAIFVLVLNKYYGADVRTKAAHYLERWSTSAAYDRYRKEAAELRPETVSGEAKSVPVLVYHGIVTGASRNEEELSLEVFKEQLFALKRAGYRTITLREYREALMNGKAVPEKSFVLTFDDGRKDSYYPVDPILAALDYTAVMFVITNTLTPEKPSPYYLSLGELRAMQKTGRWELESHGHDDHLPIVTSAKGDKGRFMSNKKWLATEARLETDTEYRDRITADLKRAKNELRDAFGIEAFAYALPGGDYGHRDNNFSEADTVIGEVVREVYPMTFYQFGRDARIGYARTDLLNGDPGRFFFRRIKVTANTSAASLLATIDASRIKSLPYRELFEHTENWISAWGNTTLSDQSLLVESVLPGNGASVFLDGAADWQDYRFDASLQLQSGKSFDLLVRSKDGANFAGCTFERFGVQLFVVSGGVNKTVASIAIPGLDPSQWNDVGIEVKDHVVTCRSKGRLALKYTVGTGEAIGGPGLRVFTESQEAPARLLMRQATFAEAK